MRRRRFLHVVGASATAALLPVTRSPAQGEDSVKVLEGVQPLGFRKGKQCTLMGCLEAVLRYHGEPYDYVDLMGLSGAAFRIRIAYPSSDRLMGGRIHPGISVDASVGPHLEALLEVTGYQRETDAHVLHKEKGGERVARRIETEVDENRPVIAMNLQGASCWGVIVGYDADVPLKDEDGECQGNRYVCRTYYDPEGSDYQRAPKFPWDVYLISKGGEALLAEEATRASVKRAVTLLETERGRVSGPTAWMAFYKPDYVNGISAYDAWVEDLEDDEGIAKLRAEQFLMYWQGHAWMYDQLHDARRAAAQYVRRIAPRFAGGARRRLLEEAAQTYDQLVQHMTEGWDCFPFSEDGYVEPDTGWWFRVEQEQFLGRQIPAYSGGWTSEMRRRGIEVLRTLREKDEKALAMLREVA